MPTASAQPRMLVGFDALLLVFLVIARMHWLANELTNSAMPAMLLAAMLYVAADLGRDAAPARVQRIKLLLLGAIIFTFVACPLARVVALRHASGKPWTWVHDNVIQMEEAVKFLLAGKNPYTESYLATPLVRWDPDSPALYHSVNLPLQILVGLPFQLLATHTLGWFDLRMVYLAIFLVACPLVYRLGGGASARLALLMIFALNPFFTSTLVEGRNDIVVIACLVAMLTLWLRGRRGAAFVFLGLLCASKHTAVVLVPFVVWALAVEAGGADEPWPSLLRRRTPLALRALWPTWLTIAILFVPFVAWSPVGFYHSVISYPFGTAEHSYPIRGDGYGLSDWVVVLGLVGDRGAYFPFAWIQALVTLPCLVATAAWQRRQRSLGAMLIAYALTLFAAQFTSRYFNQNHVGFIVFVLALGALVREGDGQRADDSPQR
jgi:hypothetical protein